MTNGTLTPLPSATPQKESSTVDGTKRLLFMVIGAMGSIIVVLSSLLLSTDRVRLDVVESRQEAHERMDGHPVEVTKMKAVQYQLTRMEEKFDRMDEKLDELIRHNGR